MGTHGNQMGTPLGQAGHPGGGGTVSEGVSRALPQCVLGVLFMKALKMLLITPE